MICVFSIGENDFDDGPLVGIFDNEEVAIVAITEYESQFRRLEGTRPVYMMQKMKINTIYSDFETCVVTLKYNSENNQYEVFQKTEWKTDDECTSGRNLSVLQ